MLNVTDLSNETLWSNSTTNLRLQPLDRTVLDKVNLYIQLVMLPVGLVGNALCLLVMSQKQNRSISCSVYMSALAITDSLVLITNALNVFLIHGVFGMVQKIGPALCRAIDYLFHTSAHTGVMIILALLFERVIVVMRPMKAAILLSPKRALIIICVMLIPTAAYSVPRIFFTSGRVILTGFKCGEFVGKDPAHTPYMIANLIIPGLLPLAAMLVMNILIVLAIKSARYQKYLRDESNISDSATSVTIDTITTSANSSTNKQENSAKKQEDRSTSKQEDRRKRRERQLTIMTIFMTSAFIVCTLPGYVHDLAFLRFDSTSPWHIKVAYFWSEMLTQNLMTLNSAINFFLYAMSGSKFRQDLVHLCKRKPG